MKSFLIKSYTFFFSLLSYIIPDRFKTQGRILIYHNMNQISVSVFARQIAWLVKNGYTFLTVEKFIQQKKAGKSCKKICAISFDDGFSSIMLHVLPVMRQYNIPITVYVNQKLHEFTERANQEQLRDFVKTQFPRLYRSNPDNITGLTEKDIEQLIAGGHEIGAHTITHRPVSTLSECELQDELQIQMVYFREKFNYQIKGFAFPYGRKKDIKDFGEDFYKKTGIQYCVTGISSNPDKCESPFYFPRTSISLGHSLHYFTACFCGVDDLKDYLLGEKRK